MRNVIRGALPYLLIAGAIAAIAWVSVAVRVDHKALPPDEDWRFVEPPPAPQILPPILPRLV